MDSLSTLDGRIVTITNATGFSSGSTYRVLFGDSTGINVIGILFVCGGASGQHSTLFVNAYGIGTNRMQIYDLGTGESISYSIATDVCAIDVTPSAATGTRVLGYFSIYGNIPTINAI